MLLLIFLLVSSAFECHATRTLYARFTLHEDLTANLWIRWREWISGCDYFSPTPWYYIGPLSAGYHSFGITAQNIGSYESSLEFGFYGSTEKITFTLSDITTNNAAYDYYIWESNNGSTTLSCSENKDGCCIFRRDLWCETENSFDFQSNGICDDSYSFETDRDGVIPSIEPTLYPSVIPSLVPTQLPVTLINNPTESPTMRSTVAITTMTTTTVDTTVDTTNTNSNENNNNNNNNGNGNNSDDLESDSNENSGFMGENTVGALLIGCGFGLVFLTTICGCIYFRQTRKKRFASTIDSTNIHSKHSNLKSNTGSPVNVVNGSIVNENATIVAMQASAIATGVTAGGDGANNRNRMPGEYESSESGDEASISDGLNEGAGAPVSIVAWTSDTKPINNVKNVKDVANVASGMSKSLNSGMNGMNGMTSTNNVNNIDNMNNAIAMNSMAIMNTMKVMNQLNNSAPNLHNAMAISNESQMISQNSLRSMNSFNNNSNSNLNNINNSSNNLLQQEQPMTQFQKYQKFQQMQQLSSSSPQLQLELQMKQLSQSQQMLMAMTNAVQHAQAPNLSYNISVSNVSNNNDNEMGNGDDNDDDDNDSDEDVLPVGSTIGGKNAI